MLRLPSGLSMHTQNRSSGVPSQRPHRRRFRSTAAAPESEGPGERAATDAGACLRACQASFARDEDEIGLWALNRDGVTLPVVERIIHIEDGVPGGKSNGAWLTAVSTVASETPFASHVGY